MNLSTFVFLIALLSLAGLVGYIYHQSRFEFGPGRTPEETAYILVKDFKFGRRAQQKAIQDGDAILPYLRQATHNFDFSRFSHLLPFLVAEVLGAIKTAESQQILTELYQGSDPVSRLIGAAGLAQQGRFPDSVDENSFLVQMIRHQGQHEVTPLAIRTLGFTQQLGALPCLLDLCQDPGPIAHGEVWEAFARISSREAIPVLSDRLMRMTDGVAFRALISLGEKNALSLAIARINPKQGQSRTMQRLVTELEWVTGKSYGYHQEKWQRWWRREEETWEIPAEFCQPWDQQRQYQYKVSFNPVEAFWLTSCSMVFKLLSKIKMES